MVTCLRCNNETRTTALVDSSGQEILVAGTMSTEAQRIAAQVCTACGFIQLFAPQPIHEGERANAAAQTEPVTLGELLGEQPGVPTA